MSNLPLKYAMKKKAKKMAMGGQITDNYQSSCTAHCETPCMVHPQDNIDLPQMAEGGDTDMVGRVMKRMSKGGQVANETDIDSADHDPAQFDDLVLRDDLESSYTGANSGDELGNAQEDEDRNDIVARVMRSRAKKDRLPNPR